MRLVLGPAQVATNVVLPAVAMGGLVTVLLSLVSDLGVRDIVNVILIALLLNHLSVGLELLLLLWRRALACVDMALVATGELVLVRKLAHLMGLARQRSRSWRTSEQHLIHNALGVVRL